MKTIQEMRKLNQAELRDIALTTKGELISKNVLSIFKGVRNMQECLSVAQDFINSHEEHNFKNYLYKSDEEIEHEKELATMILKERKKQKESEYEK